MADQTIFGKHLENRKQKRKIRSSLGDITENRRKRTHMDVEKETDEQNIICGVYSISRVSSVQQSVDMKFQPINRSDSFENHKKAQILSNYPCRNFIRSFAKANILDKHPRWGEIRKGNRTTVKLSQRCPRGNIMLRPRYLKERRTFCNADAGKQGQKNKNRFDRSSMLKEIFDKQLRQTLPCQEAFIFKKPCILRTNISSKYSETRKTASYCLNDNDRAASINKKEDHMVCNIADIFGRLNLDENKMKTIDSDANFGNTCNSEMFKCKVDLSSGDDARNVCMKITGTRNDDMCGMENEQFIESKKRSVQWNSEVDVIYYTGDADGGTIVRRQREPLRKEADQQARHKDFIRFALNKNMVLLVNFQKHTKG